MGATSKWTECLHSDIPPQAVPINSLLVQFQHIVVRRRMLRTGHRFRLMFHSLHCAIIALVMRTCEELPILSRLKVREQSNMAEVCENKVK